MIVFPKVFEQYSNLIRQDLKVFISGRINIEEEKSAKILAEKIASFSSNGFGGLASMIAGILTLVGPDAMQANKFTLVTATLAIVVGGLTWAGSAVAAAKLHNVISSLPVVF